uniref:C-type lectin domain-containing protein n=1 Tax=Timema cristinae TaxID=61476 RepID=A0A7R9H779_TIMCR|nr:unnamed protein product [Timema cristinae]
MTVWNMGTRDSYLLAAILLFLLPPGLGVISIHDDEDISPEYELAAGVGYYRFYEKPMSWYEAFKVCRDERGHLAVINSNKEAKILKRLYDRYPTADDEAYVGVHDFFQDGLYLSIFGVRLDEEGYDRWVEPGTQPHEDCGTVIRAKMEMSYSRCVEPRPFFCEIELSEAKRRHRRPFSSCIKNMYTWGKYKLKDFSDTLRR